MPAGQWLALAGLVVDLLGASVVVLADVRGPRERLLRALETLPAVDGTYARVHRGLRKARGSELTPDDEEFLPVLEYLLAYTGEVDEESPVLRERTADEYVHRMRLYEPGSSKVPDVRDHPLYRALFETEPESAEIRLTDVGDRIVVEVGENRGEFSRWHDTERFDEELYDLFLRVGFLVLLAGFAVQILAQVAVVAG